MISTKKTLIFCVLSFVYLIEVSFSLVESANFDEINIM